MIPIDNQDDWGIDCFFDGEALKKIIANPNYPCLTFLLLTSSNVHSFRIFKRLRA
jgi:hypothetical protein